VFAALALPVGEATMAAALRQALAEAGSVG